MHSTCQDCRLDDGLTIRPKSYSDSLHMHLPHRDLSRLTTHLKRLGVPAKCSAVMYQKIATSILEEHHSQSLVISEGLNIVGCNILKFWLVYFPQYIEYSPNVTPILTHFLFHYPNITTIKLVGISWGFHLDTGLASLCPHTSRNCCPALQDFLARCMLDMRDTCVSRMV